MSCLPSVKATLKDSVFKMLHAQKHTSSGGHPGGEILADSPALSPVLFLCGEPVLFKYNGGSRKLQHLSDRHSIIVTHRAVTTNAADTNQKKAQFIFINAAFFFFTGTLLCKSCKDQIIPIYCIFLKNPCTIFSTAVTQNSTYEARVGSCD